MEQILSKNKRTLLKLGASSTASLWCTGVVSASDAVDSSEIPSEQLTEQQYGDPLAEIEDLTFDPFKVQKLFGGTRARFEPRIKDFDERLIGVAERYLGKNRKNAKTDITHFLNVFNIRFQDVSGKPTPFCAAGVSYVAAMAYLEALRGNDNVVSLSQISSIFPDIDHHFFFPSPSVLDMYHVAAGKHRWKTREDYKKVRPGWLVIFDWKQNGGANHVGIVEQIKSNDVHTIEFNTSLPSGRNEHDGGQIARKIRPLNKTIKGFVSTSMRTAI